MRQKNLKTRKNPSEARCYDVEMIRDFLEHLAWEVRIDHYESGSNAVNPELVEQLARFQKKRQTVGLLFATAFSDNELDAGKFKRFKELKAEFRQSQLLCLEALGSLFAEAFQNAAKPKTFNIASFDTVDEAIAVFERRKNEHETGEA